MSRRDGLPDSLATRIALALAAADAGSPGGRVFAAGEPHYLNPAPLYRNASARLRALVRTLDEAAARWESERASSESPAAARAVKNKHPRARPSLAD